MFAIRAVAVLLAGGLVVGCATPSRTPTASVGMQPPVNEANVADLEQSWRASHPGTQIGHINAVAPESHIASATDLPLADIHMGDVLTILRGGQGTNTLPATVFGKNSGYVQLDYGSVRPGQGDPVIGDLVVWYPSGSAAAANDAAAPPVVVPTTPAPTPAPAADASPAATPPATSAPAPGGDAVPPAAPPATPPPAPGADAPPAPAPQTTPPAAPDPSAPGAATPPPAPPSTDAPTPPPAPAPDNKPPADLNK